MPERLYTDHPELYDVIQSDWNYDRDVSFVVDSLPKGDPSDVRLLEVGCGTGEHTRRFVAEGFDVTAVDAYEGMLSIAREKTDADFRHLSLPELPDDGPFDVIVAIRGVVNHLAPDELAPALRALDSRLAPGGVLVFDNSPLPPDGNHPAIAVGTSPEGDYARIAHHVPTGDGRLEWNAITFGPDGEIVVNSRKMTPFDDDVIADALAELGLDVEVSEGYGPGDDRTVFVATT